MMLPPSLHGQISPSRLTRIIECPGSFKFAQLYEKAQQRSSYAEEGSLLHAHVERLINNNVHEINSAWRDDFSDDQIALMQACLDYYYNTLRSVADALAFTEKLVYLKKYDPCLFEAYGTCDVIIVNEHELHVIDWKFGGGIPVYAKDNDQLYAYAAGALAEFTEFPNIKDIYVHCVQPRLESFDYVVLTIEELQFWLNSRVIPGVKRALSKHAPFNPGKVQCRWCPAKNNCRARFNAANQTAADVFAAAEKFPESITYEEISKLLAKADDLESILNDFRTYFQREIENGKTIPGWKVVHGRSNRQWINAADAKDWMAEHCDGNYDQLFETKLISPARAERRFRSFKKNDEFQKLIEKPLGKHKLVNETDPRPAIEFKSVADKFQEALDEDN